MKRCEIRNKRRDTTKLQIKRGEKDQGIPHTDPIM